MSYDGNPTGVLFGVLRDIESVVDQFGSDQVVFAFDSGGSGYRGQLYPAYKANREQILDEEAQQSLTFLRQQIKRLKQEVLPAMGYKNLFRVKGYEADDILAYCAERIEGRDAVIVTDDKDLWQCLQTHVSWYGPRAKRLVTSQSFYDEWGIDPAMWATVKALAGCSSDNIAGIKGIGEKSVAKWLRNELKPSSSKYKLIEDGLGIIKQNMDLVRLPFPGLELKELVDDESTQQKRNEVLSSLGIKKRGTSARTRAVARGFWE